MPKDCKILRIDVHQAALDCPIAGHDAVTRDFLFAQPKLAGVVGDKDIDLSEGALVEQKLQTLARGHAPTRMLTGDLVCPAPEMSSRFSFA